MGRQASQLADGCSFPITIHANPKAAGVRKGFDDPYSSDGHSSPAGAAVAMRAGATAAAAMAIAG